MSDPTTDSPSLPTSNNAVVLSWFDPSVDNFPTFVEMLTGRGYQVAAVHTMDLATLRSPPSQPIGVLYILTHGLFEFTPKQPMPSQNPDDPGEAAVPLVFGLATTMPSNVKQSQLSAADWAALQADIHANPPRLAPGEFTAATRSASGAIVPGSTKGFFCATVAFFQHYWGAGTFAQNSMVFVNGCFSAQDEFQDACVAAGADLVLGWTLPVRLLDAANTANFIFDRMLGANCQSPLCFPELVAQRPFDWDTVAGDFKNHTNVGNGSPLGTSIANFQGTATDVVLSPLMSGLSGLLVPSIVCIGVNEITNQIYVNGSFGSAVGTVMILDSLGQGGSGNALKVETWTPQMVTCTMPAGGAGAGQACGYVVVSVDTRKSNCVPLTEWSGQITAKAIGGGSLLDTVVFDCHLRVDAHLYRTSFNSKLNSGSYASVPRIAMASQDSTCNYTGTGNFTFVEPGDTTITDSLSGSGSVPSLSSAPPGAGSGAPSVFNVTLEATLTVDDTINETHTVLLQLFIPGNPDPTPTYSIVLTSQSGDQPPSTSNLDALEFCSDFGPLKLLDGASTYDLPDPNIQLSSLGGVLPSAALNLLLEVAYPPDPSKGEDYMPILG